MFATRDSAFLYHESGYPPNQRVRQYLTNFGLGFRFGYRFARQRKNRRASLLKSDLVRLTIRETLASRALDGNVCTFPVIDAKRHAV
jgi:hypothetical protein